MRWRTVSLISVSCFLAGTWCGQRAVLPNASRMPSVASQAFADEEKPRTRRTNPSVSAELVAKKDADERSSNSSLRIIVFGAHPDDCEIKAGGTGALWAAQGHKVKFVSLTNGDIGHWREAGGPLARRRYEEVQQAAKLLGVTTEVLDNHDGELMPTLENRRAVTRLIREWQADVVIGPRTNDYHPDHRYTGVLVQDAAYMVAVPFFCPDTPPLTRNPVFLYLPDQFQKPYPFRADVVVGIDSVAEKKWTALVDMESQFVEGGALGSAENVDGGDPKREQRRRTVRDAFQKRDKDLADRFRDQLSARFGDDVGQKIAFAEAFELCEYGRQPTVDELRKLFPFNQ